MKVVEFRNVEKTFGRFRVLKGLSFEIRRGERVALLGPNGSGKTTTIKLISGQIRPTGGEVRVFGKSRVDEPVKVKIGVVSHNPFLYEDLTAYENLEFFARMYGADVGKIGELLRDFGLWRRRHELVKNYSRGMKQRLSIARALLNDPELLILDEPTTGLDVEGRKRLFGAISSYDATILFTTHNLSEVEALCERVLIIREGELVYDGSAEGVERIYDEVME